MCKRAGEGDFSRADLLSWVDPYTSLEALRYDSCSFGGYCKLNCPETGSMEEHRPRISRGETEVLKALWNISQGSVGDIYDAVDPSLEMDYTTVQTYVRRLEAKGYLHSSRRGRLKIYSAAIRRSQLARETIDDFVQRIFDGDILPMFKHMVSGREVSSEEIEDLMKIVEELKQDREDRDAR
ncbi:MAG: BlaI/MecI/CopY family transcriptional regulator [Planctomycetota bacterium]